MESVVCNLRFGKIIKSPQDMRQLADDMKNAKVILAQIDMMHEVSSQTVLLDIVERLQNYLQKRWDRRALEIKNSKGFYPTQPTMIWPNF